MSDKPKYQQYAAIASQKEKQGRYQEAISYYRLAGQSALDLARISQGAIKSSLMVQIEFFVERGEALKVILQKNDTSSNKISSPVHSNVPNNLQKGIKRNKPFIASTLPAPSKPNEIISPLRKTDIQKDNESNKNIANDEYEQLILNDLVDRSPNIKWEDVAGMEYAKQTLMETVILPSKRPDIFTGLRAPPRGILLFGPPGTGKTMLAKAVASESNATFFSISSSSLTSKWVGESEKLVRALFSIASKLSPSVIFIDEIDSILCSRSDKENEASRRLKTEFLVQMDGVKSDSNERILLIGATNRPFELDDAVLRRLSKKIYVPLPDDSTRLQLINSILKNEKTKITKQEMTKIIELTEGYSGSDIKQLCKEAMMNTVRDIRSIETINVKDLRPANIQDFYQALQVIKPSVSKESLNDYIRWNTQFGVQADGPISSPSSHKIENNRDSKPKCEPNSPSSTVSLEKKKSNKRGFFSMFSSTNDDTDY